MNYKILIFFLALIIIVLIIAIVFCVNKMCNCERKGRKCIPLGKNKKYLNCNSTLNQINGALNYSDSLFPETQQQQKELEEVKNKIKSICGANKNDTVIFCSSCSEAVATLMHWAAKLNPYGTVIGSDFDHSVAKDNAENYGLKYEKTLDSPNLNDNAGVIFLTHVNSATGEIMPINKYLKNLGTYSFLQDHGYSDEIEGKVLQYRPLVCLDATQSLLKEPINMNNVKDGMLPIDVVVASLHKIGFDLNFSGVMVISKRVKNSFVPLIAGAQQGKDRGSSVNFEPIIASSYLLDHFDDRSKRKQKWQESYDYLTGKGLNVYKPKFDHLYSTLLIDTNNKCTLETIEKLSSKHGIYVGNKSACTNDKYKQNINGGTIVSEGQKLKPFDNAIRVSFMDPKALDNATLDIIAEELLKLK